MLAAILLAAPGCHAQRRGEVTPIRIAAGESVTLERVAAKGEDVFELAARAGQTLTLAKDDDENCPNCPPVDTTHVDALRVYLVDAKGSKDLATPEDYESCLDWRWINVLPTSGVYHIVVRTQSEIRYRLRVSLLNPHDPLFDPGITADRISIASGLFPPGSRLTLKTFGPSDYIELLYSPPHRRRLTCSLVPGGQTCLAWNHERGGAEKGKPNVGYGW